VRGIAPVSGGQRSVFPLGGKMVLNNCLLESGQWNVVAGSNAVVEVNHCTMRPSFGVSAAWVPVEVQDSRSYVTVNSFVDASRCISTNGGTLLFPYEATNTPSAKTFLGSSDGTNLVHMAQSSLDLGTNAQSAGRALFPQTSTTRVWDTVDWSLPYATNFFYWDTNILIVTGAGNTGVATNSPYTFNSNSNWYDGAAFTRVLSNLSGLWGFKQAGSANIAYSNVTLVSMSPWALGNGASPGPITRHAMVMTNTELAILKMGGATNAPADTNNFIWVEAQMIGRTNSYRFKLYQ